MPEVREAASSAVIGLESSQGSNIPSYGTQVPFTNSNSGRNFNPANNRPPSDKPYSQDITSSPFPQNITQPLDSTLQQLADRVNLEYAQVGENDTTPAGAVLLPMVEQGQQKAASTGEAGGCRSVNSKNMEMPAVPMINFSKWTTADINRGTVPKRENDRIKMVFKTAV